MCKKNWLYRKMSRPVYKYIYDIMNLSSVSNLCPPNLSFAQLTFTCLKSTIETLDNGMKYVQS